jgi:hypothetical protein
MILAFCRDTTNFVTRESRMAASSPHMFVSIGTFLHDEGTLWTVGDVSMNSSTEQAELYASIKYPRACHPNRKMTSTGTVEISKGSETGEFFWKAVIQKSFGQLLRF